MRSGTLLLESYHKFARLHRNRSQGCEFVFADDFSRGKMNVVIRVSLVFEIAAPMLYSKLNKLIQLASLILQT